MEVFQVFVTKSGGFSGFEEKSIKKKKKNGGFSSFRNQKWRILRKKTPKVEDFQVFLTKSGGFC